MHAYLFQSLRLFYRLSQKVSFCYNHSTMVFEINMMNCIFENEFQKPNTIDWKIIYKYQTVPEQFIEKLLSGSLNKKHKTQDIFLHLLVLFYDLKHKAWCTNKKETQKGNTKILTINTSQLGSKAIVFHKHIIMKETAMYKLIAFVISVRVYTSNIIS